MSLQKVVSFGYRHEWPPEKEPGVLILDVRQLFRNPYHDKRLRKFRGTDRAVQVDIEKTPDFLAKYQALKECASVPGIDTVYIGCHGGHHRSVYIAELLAKDLGVPVEHRDYDKP